MQSRLVAGPVGWVDATNKKSATDAGRTQEGELEMIRAVDGQDGKNGAAVATTGASAKKSPESLRVRVLRQDSPGRESYWECHVIPYSRT